MIAVLTGELIFPQTPEGNRLWQDQLRELLQTAGDSPDTWQLYRGNRFELKTTPEEALRWALKIDTCMRMHKGMSARIGIGIGEEGTRSSSILDNQGEARQYAERAFKKISKTQQSFWLKSPLSEMDSGLNSGMELLMALARQWSSNQAHLALALLSKPNYSQEEIASLFHISQSAVSQRKKRAHIDPIERYLRYAQNLIKKQLGQLMLA